MVPPPEPATPTAAPPSPSPVASHSPPDASVEAAPARTDAGDVPVERSATPAKSTSCAGTFRMKEEVLRRCQCIGDLCALDPTDAAAVRAQVEMRLVGAASVASKKTLAFDVLLKNKDATRPVAFGLMQDRHVGWTVKDGNGVSAATMEHDCDPWWTRQLDKKRKAPAGFRLVYLGPNETRRLVTEVATDVYRPYPTSPPKEPACLVGFVIASPFGGSIQRGSLLAAGRYTVEVSLPFADATTSAATSATTTFDVK